LAVDDSTLLPKAPPPRPAARDGAIGAAMRRFDGIANPPAPPREAASRRGWGGRPKMGMLVTASLVAVIGLPAILIAIRDNDVERAPSAPVERAAPRSPRVAADVAETPAAPPALEADATPVALKPTPEPNRYGQLPGDEFAGAVQSTPVVAMSKSNAAPVAAAPPAPPPPPAPAAERDAEVSADASDESIVVTGSRMAQPNAWAERARDGRGKNRSLGRAEEAAATAPDWVLNDRSYDTFLRRLQTGVRANNRNAVAGLVAYPLRVNRNGQARTYANARAVIADYDSIFTPRVRSAILSQRFENLFGRDQGVMIGDGAVWFDHMCRTPACSPPGPVRIKAINP
jgi:hypothetical protein